MDVFAVEAFAASWIEIVYKAEHLTVDEVEAFAASWIEIDPASKRRFSEYVEAFAASWIEIVMDKAKGKIAGSKPLRLRGLKCTLWTGGASISCRSLCGFVD